jgi:hypothetical protein
MFAVSDELKMIHRFTLAYKVFYIQKVVCSVITTYATTTYGGDMHDMVRPHCYLDLFHVVMIYGGKRVSRAHGAAQVRLEKLDEGRDIVLERL